MDLDKIKTIQNFQSPCNRKQVQAFLGFLSRDLSKLTSQLSNLLKKLVSWCWEESHQTAFEEIKRLFLEDIIIQYPDFNQCFYLSTDASNTYIGAELFQIDEGGKHRTLGFISRTLDDAEKNYHTTETGITCNCVRLQEISELNFRTPN